MTTNPENVLAMIHSAATISETAIIGPGVILPEGVTVEERAAIGAGVVFAAEGRDRIVVRAHCRIAAGAVIGPDVELGRGCEVRAGSAVLKSIPPNAIVEGNPAVIVGYTQQPSRSRFDIPEAATAPSAVLEFPAIKHLGVGEAAIYRMKRVSDLRGSLTVAEMDKELPFRPRRYFIVFDVESSELRGEHAHKECHQFLLVVRGSCRVLLDDGKARSEVTLESPDVAIYMPPMIWGTQYRYTRDAVLVVFASHPYDAKDYIRNYDEFLFAVREHTT
jgi:UDP-2-acetamido-3-amino-2,3-dideoxy-glucuronate N-acetyltransferase